jgi:hypothetical protein
MCRDRKISIPPPRGEDRKEALAFLTRILKLNGIARKDRKMLDARVRGGGCATTSLTTLFVVTVMLDLERN